MSEHKTETVEIKYFGGTTTFFDVPLKENTHQWIGEGKDIVILDANGEVIYSVKHLK